MIKKILFLFLFVGNYTLSQNTVGTISVTNEAYDGFTIFSIHQKTYLIDNCGRVIHEWTSAYPPGNAVYLLPNGNLLRASRNDGESQISFGGRGGVIELFDWDGNLIWQYEYNTDDYRQHHDVYPMPSGNVLILAATVMTQAEAIQAGRDPSLLDDNELYNERIFEVGPVGANQANVVWEWNIKDHLVQNFDNTKDNFGSIASNPGKLNINFLNGSGAGANWLHINSIQYYETFDQIVISSRNLSEIWIIDHSTTTAEAASGSGGNYGKGGDFLYRWGNPQSYDHGNESDRKLYGQHYPHFIESGLVDAGKIILFNNGNDRIPAFSEVFILDTPMTSPGVYTYSTLTPYGPINPDYIYADPTNNPSDFYSPIVSSAQRLPNGNILVCQGSSGRFFELNASDQIVWEYINPIRNDNGVIANQTESISANTTFRAIKYTRTYGAFTGRDVTPGLPIEGNPDLTPCNTLSVDEVVIDEIKIYPNPASDKITVATSRAVDKIEIYTLLGKKINEVLYTNEADLSKIKSGLYLIKIYADNTVITKKIIKE
ncbi:MAG: T9SS type A sorting domain-containing protein [Flavobacteriaceae bacterium]|nr:MAG: T9SS type A sorting domain-containing protein [Flavobacteriaceae bacterium]